MRTPRLETLLPLALAAAAISCAGVGAADQPVGVPRIDSAFWTHWGDGKAEMAGYRLTYPRYSAERPGTAVTIFVTETFAEDARVKHERPVRSADRQFPVMKLNLVQDFSTGVYDYNLMTSAFVGLAPSAGRGTGAVSKVSFSSQEWCGHVYAQTLFDADRVRLVSHSYFDGEADQERELEHPAGGLPEDALLLWARGLVAPVLAPGEAREVPLLRSLEDARLRHRDVDWGRVRVERSASTTPLVVPAGSFAVRVLTADPTRSDAPGRWTFWVEDAAPHRLVAWEDPHGARAELLGSDRLTYWGMSGPGMERQLERLGLRPRPPLAP